METIGMVPETERPTTLRRVVAAGEARAPAESGMPDVDPDLAESIESLADIPIADQNRERRRAEAARRPHWAEIA